jgi:putative membrane protein
MLILLATAIVIVMAASRYLFNDRDQGGGQETALDILNKRYAKGEIDKKEYRELKQDIAENANIKK